MRMHTLCIRLSRSLADPSCHSAWKKSLAPCPEGNISCNGTIEHPKVQLEPNGQIPCRNIRSDRILTKRIGHRCDTYLHILSIIFGWNYRFIIFGKFMRKQRPNPHYNSYIFRCFNHGIALESRKAKDDMDLMLGHFSWLLFFILAT